MAVGVQVTATRTMTLRKPIQPGDTFNRLTVERIAGVASNGGRRWLCACLCGGTKVVNTSELSSGDTQSCGCLQKERSHDNRVKRRADLTGMQLGQTTGVVLGSSDQYIERKNGNRALLWRCKCDCGAEFLGRGDKLQHGKLIHCATHRRNNKKHIDYVAIRQKLKLVDGYKLVPKADKTAITLAAGKGDKYAAELLLLMYNEFAYHTAREFAALHRVNGEYDIDELAQECKCAMLKSAQTWDPALGASFTTWSRFLCKSYMQHEPNSNTSIIYVPTLAHTRESTRGYVERSRQIASIDAPLDDDGDRSLLDVVGDNQPDQEDRYAECEQRALIRRSMDVLDIREKRIITMRYLSDNEVFYDEIAVHFGVTRQCIQQLESRALRKLRRHIERLD